VITDEEVVLMERTLVERTGISAGRHVVEISRQQARLFGSTEDYLVTREFKRVSTPEQRLGVIRACFQVAAANDEISSPESAVLNQIATELEIDPADFDAVRTEHREQSVVRAIRSAGRLTAARRARPAATGGVRPARVGGDDAQAEVAIDPGSAASASSTSPGRSRRPTSAASSAS
jgi:uncharacterized tellurite resistance protein B-like protein